MHVAFKRDGRVYGYIAIDNTNVEPTPWSWWEDSGVHIDPNKSPHYSDSHLDVENVPEKFGRWMTFYIYDGFVVLDGYHGDESDARERVNDLKNDWKPARIAFAYYVSGSDGDVIGGEDE